jgi:hypothetical protein
LKVRTKWMRWHDYCSLPFSHSFHCASLLAVIFKECLALWGSLLSVMCSKNSFRALLSQPFLVSVVLYM